MDDTFTFDIFLNKEIIENLLLVASLVIMFIILLVSNRGLEKSNERLQNEITEQKKFLDLHSTYLSQFSDHFGLVDRKLKNLEEITSITNRDISAMAEGITGEVGVGKAIELARRGASVEEILKSSNLREDQAELIVKFHGSVD